MKRSENPVHEGEMIAWFVMMMRRAGYVIRRTFPDQPAGSHIRQDASANS